MNPFSLIKFLGGFNVFNPEKLGKLLFYFILIAVSLAIFYKAFVVPTSKTVIQKQIIEKQIINNEKKEKLFIGAKCFGLNLGLSL